MIEPIDPVAGIRYPARLAQLRSWFATDDDCRDYLEWLRWPGGFVCPGCSHTRAWRGREGLLRCGGCRRRVSVSAGTIFQDTRTPLTVWFEAVWLMTVPKNGISALTLSRVLPIGSYQTAWTMLGKLRAAMSSIDKDRLRGVVEVDEWYHGGVAPGGTSLTGKTLVVCAIEHAPSGRGFGRVRFRIIPERTTWALRKAIVAMVEPRSRIITDGLNAYPAAMAGYVHEPHNESAPGAEEPHVLLPGVHLCLLPGRTLAAVHPSRRRAHRTPA